MSDDFVKSFGFIKEDTPRYIRQNYNTLINWCRFRLSEDIYDKKKGELPHELEELLAYLTGKLPFEELEE